MCWTTTTTMMEAATTVVVAKGRAGRAPRRGTLVRTALTAAAVAVCIVTPSTLHPTTVDAFATHPATTTTRSSVFGGRSTLRRTRMTHTATRLLDDDVCDVAIFGGGFGGLYTALALAAQQRQNSNNKQTNGRPLDIVLVDPSHDFVFLPLLYDLTVGTASEAEVCPSYTDLLQGTGIRHVTARLQSLNATASVAQLVDGSSDSSRDSDAGTSTTAAQLRYRQAAVVGVGASPASILASVPGASQHAQPFYTASDAKATRRLLNRLAVESSSQPPQQTSRKQRLAVVGGGYGGVELAASVQRRLPDATVVLVSRGGPPMRGTRAESIVSRALAHLGVTTVVGDVTALESATKESDDDNDNVVSSSWSQRIQMTREQDNVVTKEVYDAVFWTAGSGPSPPVPDQCYGLMTSDDGGRLSTDGTLRCRVEDNKDDKYTNSIDNNVWALGDCAHIWQDPADPRPSPPKTAQTAMQQADTVARNILADGQQQPCTTFVYQDLGSMLTLGGPNAALLAPAPGSPLEPLLAPVLGTAATALSVADQLVSTWWSRPVQEKTGWETPDSLGLSLGGGHGLGGIDEASKSKADGTWAGTLTGAARRAVYAARMPTPQQRAVALVSATLSTAAALTKEVAERKEREDTTNSNE